MKVILACPVDGPAAGFLGRQKPLALAPVLGRARLDLKLEELAREGVDEVTVVVVDRPDEVRRFVGAGERWGIRVLVAAEREEPTPEQALARHGPAERVERLAAGGDGGAEAFYQEVAGLVAAGTAADRLTMREVSPGVFISTRARVPAAAGIEAPCWIGPHAWVAPGARLGPGCIVEARAYVDAGVHAERSWIGPRTYVGSMVELRDSLAWGTGLLNWRSGSFTEVRDEFLLADLGRAPSSAARSGLIGRLVALLVVLVTLPVALVLLLVALLRRRGGPVLPARKVLCAPVAGEVDFARTCVARELAGGKGLWRRWPELLNIVRGEFCWVGNRPLTRQQAAGLADEFERLWLAVPPGLISLADACGAEAEFDDEARVHAAYYAAHRSGREDLKILTSLLRRPGRSRAVVDAEARPEPEPTVT